MENVKQEKRLSLAAKPMSRHQLLTAGDLFDFKLLLLFEIKTLLKGVKLLFVQYIDKLSLSIKIIHKSYF